MDVAERSTLEKMFRRGGYVAKVQGEVLFHNIFIIIDIVMALAVAIPVRLCSTLQDHAMQT